MIISINATQTNRTTKQDGRHNYCHRHPFCLTLLRRSLRHHSYHTLSVNKIKVIELMEKMKYKIKSKHMIMSVRTITSIQVITIMHMNIVMKEIITVTKTMLSKFQCI